MRLSLPCAMDMYAMSMEDSGMVEELVRRAKNDWAIWCILVARGPCQLFHDVLSAEVLAV
jgi:hypothetical protein